MLYSSTDILRIQADVRMYDLEYPVGFWDYRPNKLCTMCNGVGPEGWSEGVRQWLDGALWDYRAAVALHDVGYTLHTEPKETVDRAFKKNLLIIWEFKWGTFRWIRPRALSERALLKSLYAAVALFGSDAWEAGEGSEKEGK